MINVRTEKEAKGMKCPSPSTPSSSLECEGSECMAWRWVEDGGRFSNCGEYSKGYCGLAGKP